jgi:hypothetical protein
MGKVLFKLGPRGWGGGGVGGWKERIKTVYHFLSSLLIGLAFWKLSSCELSLKILSVLVYSRGSRCTRYLTPTRLVSREKGRVEWEGGTSSYFFPGCLGMGGLV